MAQGHRRPSRPRSRTFWRRKSSRWQLDERFKPFSTIVPDIQFRNRISRYVTACICRLDFSHHAQGRDELQHRHAPRRVLPIKTPVTVPQRFGAAKPPTGAISHIWYVKSNTRIEYRWATNKALHASYFGQCTCNDYFLSHLAH